jgi:hypothetical protein
MLKDNIILFYKKEYYINEFDYKKINHDKSIFKLGKVADNKFYEWISYNKFKKTPEKLPKLDQIKIPNKIVNRYLCGNNKNMTNEVQEINNNLYKMINVGTKFRKLKYLISIRNDKKVIIFEKEKNDIFENDIIGFYFCINLFYLSFNNKIKTYFPKKIFIVKYNDTFTIREFILLHISNNKYIYINDYNECYKFISYDLITKFLIINKRIYAIDKLNNFYIIEYNSGKNKFTVMTENNINLSPKKLYKLYESKIIIKNYQVDYRFREYPLNLNTDIDNYSIFFIKPDGSKEIINKKKIIKLMKDYANEVGIYKLKYKKIYNK